ncbi:MAG: sigma-70 family RNA polymerase sigma factor [Myxococcota bacterium]
MVDDLVLLTAWREGDTHAGNLLFERYFSSLYGFFRRKTEDGPEDLVQETLLACVRGRDSLRDSSKFRGYLFGVARFTLYRHFEKQTKERSRIDFGVSSVHDLGPSPSANAARREEEALLVRALNRIPLELQIALELYYFEQLRGPELAGALGVPEGTARSRLRRGLELLKKRVAEIAESPGLLRSTLADISEWSAGIEELLARGRLQE